MSQGIFFNPFVSSAPALQSGSVGNGTLTIDALTHFTVTQTYTVVCTAISPFTVFQVIGSLDGPVGVAQVGQQFHDPDLKIFFTINQGPTQFDIGDTFVLGVTQGTDVTQQNLDTYDHLPQKNFSPGIIGTNSGDDNFRFTTTPLTAIRKIQDLTFTSLLSDEAGNSILIEYYNTSVAERASLTIQDLKYEADAAGSLGNGISVEYEQFTPGNNASRTIQDVLYIAANAGAAGNGISIEYTTGGIAGSEVVSVLGQAITVQIASGDSTADQIKKKINIHPVANTLVAAFSTGTGLESQTAPVSPTNLMGGTDPIGNAGSEVVTVTSQAIKVKFESGISSAQQIKTAVDNYAPAAALVNVSVVGLASAPQAAPIPQANLSGGTDSIGSPGNEIVSVTDTHIKVGFQSGINTAANVKAAIEANVQAAALVSITVTGTASNSQSAPSKQYLSGGAFADQWSLNINEISSPLSTYIGSGSLLVGKLAVQETSFFRKDSIFKDLVTLDDIESPAHLSGPKILNLQQTINKISENQKVFLGTEDHSKVRWNAPNLYFTAPLVLRFEQSNHLNRVLHTTFSPLNIPDGYSVYVVADRYNDANLTPIVASIVPPGEDVFRLVTRFGSCIQFYDNTILCENQVARIGAAIDLSAQVFTLFEAHGNINHDPVTIGRIYWSTQLKFRPLGSSAEVTVLANEITLADDEVAYVQFDDPIVTTTKVVQKAPRSNVLMNRPDIFWLFHRYGNRINIRFGGELEPGEERNIGDTLSDDILTVLDMAGETDSSLSYTTILGGPAVPNNVVVNGEGLQKSIKRLDQRTGELSAITQDDRNLKMVKGGVWGWELSAANTLSWDQAAYIEIPFLSLSRNTIPAGSIQFANDGDVAYVELNRTPGVASNLTVQVTPIASLIPTDNTLVIARRVGLDILVGSHSFLLKNAERLELDGALAEINRYFTSLRFKEHPTNKKRVILTGSDTTLLNGTILTQTLNNKILNFTGAVIDFSNGTIYASDETTIIGTNFTPGPITASQYFWYGVALLFGADLGDNSVAVLLKVDKGTSSNNSPLTAHKPTITGDRPIGWVYVKDDGSGNIENITTANFRQIVFGTGGGGGAGGSGNEVYDEGTLVGTGVTKFDFVGSGVSAALVSPGRVAVTVTGGGSGSGGAGIPELTTNCEGDVRMELAPCNEDWIIEDSNFVRWKVRVNDDGTLYTDGPTAEPVTPLFRVTTPVGFSTIRVNTSGALFTDDVNLFGPLDDKFHLRSINNFIWRVGVNGIGQIVMYSATKDSMFRITDEYENNYEITRLTDYGVLKYSRLFPAVANLPSPPPLFTGTVPTAWVTTPSGPRHVYWDAVTLQWKYVHSNAAV